ncbi:MAG TPA: hypothetical protein VG345_04915 [Bryobacteraceae bacterium]|nr:hypothetical protein [Bryobacteraceae bacterium]
MNNNAMMRNVVASALSIFAVPELHSFQNPASGSPARGAIHGRVIEAKSGEPVKKAVVIIRRAQEPGLGAVTDPSGEFLFESVDPERIRSPLSAVDSSSILNRSEPSK